MTWLDTNLELLRLGYDDMDTVFDGGVCWVRIPQYPMQTGVWTVAEVEIAFRIPSTAGEAPYGFWARPNLTLVSGETVNNYSYPATTPWGSDWGQFSFSPSEPWQPKADIRLGPNMVKYARAVGERLAEGA